MHRKAKHASIPDYFRNHLYEYSELFSEMFYSEGKKREIRNWKNIMWG
jgi:hypothetical protein